MPLWQNAVDLKFVDFMKSVGALAAPDFCVRGTKQMRLKKKHLIFLLAPFIMLLSNGGYAEPVFEVKTSKPGDGFFIGIPKHWNDKVYASEKGTTYAYWDGIGNALTITVREPNSFEKVLMMIKNDEFNSKKLKELENYFKQEAPLKRSIKLGIEVISNQKALAQSYLYRQETAGFVYFLKNKQFEFIKNGKQYQISFSPPPSKTEEEAEIKFNDSYGDTFYPILVTFFLK